MLKTIVQHSAELIAFLVALKIVLYQPQIRHLTQMVDALLVCPNEKTLSNLYRQLVGEPNPKNAADFFRESTWSVDAVSKPRKAFMLLKLLAAAQALHLTSPLLVSIDDSLGEKDKATRHLEAVDYTTTITVKAVARNPSLPMALCMSMSICNSGRLVSLLICDPICARKPCGGSTGSGMRTTVCTIAASMPWPARCWWNCLTYCFQRLPGVCSV